MVFAMVAMLFVELKSRCNAPLRKQSPLLPAFPGVGLRAGRSSCILQANRPFETHPVSPSARTMVELPVNAEKTSIMSSRMSC